jgi:diacylglycerol kinase family enzyme
MVSTSAATDSHLQPAPLPRAPILADRPFAARTAFLLNANARAVNDRLTERLAEVVPAGDLFLSRSLDDAQVFARTIARRGYNKVFLGGGDGTVVTTVRLIQEACDQLGLAMPQVGVLKLGTGNALATALHALSPVVDAHHVVQRGPLVATRVDMVEDEDGLRMPFAGMGYDGAVLNDYVWLKKKAHDSGSAFSPVLRGLAESVFGYLGAMLARTVPAHLKKKAPHVRITSSKTTYQMVSTPAGDVERVIPAGSVIY